MIVNNHQHKSPGVSASTMSPPTSPPPRPAPLLSPAPYTLRSITGTEHCPTSDKRYARSRIAVFRTAAGDECPINSDDDDYHMASIKPRISSVTDVSMATPDTSAQHIHSRHQLEQQQQQQQQQLRHHDTVIEDEEEDEHEFDKRKQQHTGHGQTECEDEDQGDADSEGAGSTYSHASAVNLDDLDDDDLAGLRNLNLDIGSTTNAPLNTHTPDNNRAPHRQEEEEEEEGEEGEEGQSDVVISKQALDMRRQSFANSFARARQQQQAKAKKEKDKAVINVRDELQPRNHSITLMERCICGLMEVLDMNVGFAKSTTERFVAFHPLYTKEEKHVVAELLRETTTRLRNEANKQQSKHKKVSQWKSSILWNKQQQKEREGSSEDSTAHFGHERHDEYDEEGQHQHYLDPFGNRQPMNNLFRVVGIGGVNDSRNGPPSMPTTSYANGKQVTVPSCQKPLSTSQHQHQHQYQQHQAKKKQWLVPTQTNKLSNDTMVRSVVFGAHIIPGAQSAEAILMRMAGEFHREEMTRRVQTRAERIDIPLSFCMTLTATLAAFARLECSASFRKYGSNRRKYGSSRNPHALIWLKTKYDGMRLSFAVTLHGESPCTVLFKRPRIFSLRKIDDYATLVTEAKDILIEFGRDVVGSKE